MKRATVVLLGLALCVAPYLTAEPTFKSISVSQTVQSTELPEWTQSVLIVSDGASTCYFRLFTDVDTAGNATTSSGSIKSGESLGFTFVPKRTASPEYPMGARDSQATGTAGKVARYYKSISSICSSGQTATWRVWAQ
jgi:hypothetical protein